MISSRSLMLIASITLALSPIYVQAEEQSAEDEAQVELTPEAMGDALSCRSSEAAANFTWTIFGENNPPTWMHELQNATELEGMVGIVGYQLDDPVYMLGEPVDKVYFVSNWIVTLMPREQATSFIESYEMERAPYVSAEQYYRFLDPDTGPMLGAFAPTGDSVADAFAKALGAEVPERKEAESLFVGCNYAVASEQEFLDMAKQADEIMENMSQEMGEMLKEN